MYFQYRCREPITLNGHLSPLAKARLGARWLLTKRGLGATNHFESCGFIRSQAGVRWPDIQYHFLPPRSATTAKQLSRVTAFKCTSAPTGPRAGTQRLGGPGLRDEPQIRFNYLESARDREDWRRCLRLTREIPGRPGPLSRRRDPTRHRPR